MNRILPSCSDVSHIYSQAMDHTIPWRKRLGLRLHLIMCIWCRRNAKQFQLMRYFARQQAFSQKGKARLSNETKKRISQSIDKNMNPS